MLPDSFTDVLKQWGVEPPSRLLLAVSGGIDSMVLFHMASSSSFEIGVAHMNFNLRSNDSDADQKLVAEISEAHKVPFYSKQVDTKNYAIEHGVSIQVAARELRYAWFEELMKEHNYDYLLTAHHLNDSLETSLFHFTRGGSLASLRGIPEKTGQILRPLLSFSRQEIESYAEEHKLSWREDLSNADDKYLRNFLRINVVPKLREINPSLEKTFLRNSERLNAGLALVKQEALGRWQKYGRVKDDVVYIDKDALTDGNIAVAEELLSAFQLTFSQMKNLLAAVSSDKSSQVFEGPNHTLVVDREQIIITPIASDIDELVLDVRGGSWEINGGTIKIYQSEGSQLLREKYAVSFDADKVGNRLTLRPWREGDRIQPLGMQGKKKVSDLMIDEKIPLNLKNRVWVLEASESLVWVVGLRISEQFKVEPDTSRILNIVFEHDQPI